MPRVLDPSIAAALDEVPAASLPNLRLEGDLDAVQPALAEELGNVGFGPPWLRSWLTDDVSFLARLFQDLTGERHLQVRVEAVDDDACTRFHADNVRFRLVSTYRGPGTQWVVPNALALHQPDEDPPSYAIRQLGRGEVAIMRGRRAETPDCPSLLHRSPPIAGTGIVRLFLAIDEAARAS
jgi:hypothetical protein